MALLKVSVRNTAKPAKSTSARFVKPKQIQKPTSASPRVVRATRSAKMAKAVARQAAKKLVKPTIKGIIVVPTKPPAVEVSKPPKQKKAKWQPKVAPVEASTVKAAEPEVVATIPDAAKAVEPEVETPVIDAEDQLYGR